MSATVPVATELDYTPLKPSELAEALEDCFRSRVVPIVLSSPGMGKSAIIKQVVKKMKMNLVDERVSTMDLSDWRGVPDIDRKRKRTVWYAPNFLPEEDGSDGDTCVFFDEITQCPPQCQPPLYQLLLDSCIGTVWKAPENVWWATAGNLMEDGTFVNRIGAALRDRMVLLRLIPNVDDWCEWAHGAGIAPSVIAFNRRFPHLHYAFDKSQWASPTCRGWEMVSKIVKNAKSIGNPRSALIEGKIGHGPMLEFTAFEKLFATLPSLEAIRKNPDTALIPGESEPALTYAVANALAQTMTMQNIGSTVRYINRLPDEYSVFCMSVAVNKDAKLKHTQEYTQWYLRHPESN